MDKVYLKFKYNYWKTIVKTSGPNPVYSQNDMKRYIVDSIKETIIGGFHDNYENEFPLFLTIPFFSADTFKKISSIKVLFKKCHKFKWHVVSDNENDTEISYDYPIEVEVNWNCD